MTPMIPSMPGGKQAFRKPWLDYGDQIKVLESRGLQVQNPQEAQAWLAHVNYYRFSGYSIAFESTRHVFRPGSSFEQVQAAYVFDQKLRSALMDAIAVVEIDLRTSIAHHFGKVHAPFAHAEGRNFYQQYRHPDWLTKLQHETERSHEDFVEHFRQHYQEFPNLPIWMATELMSFGTLSLMLKMMQRDDQKAIAARYKIQARFLESWVHHLVYIRNVCAHHARVWDRHWSIKPELPPTPKWSQPYLADNSRLYATILILLHLLRHCQASQVFFTDWTHRIQNLLHSPPQALNAQGRMGLTNQWSSHPFFL